MNYKSPLTDHESFTISGVVADIINPAPQGGSMKARGLNGLLNKKIYRHPRILAHAG